MCIMDNEAQGGFTHWQFWQAYESKMEGQKQTKTSRGYKLTPTSNSIEINVHKNRITWGE